MLDVLAANKLTAAGYAVLLVSALLFLFLWRMLPSPARSIADAQHPPISAARDLPALHLLAAADLKLRHREDGTPEEKKKLEERAQALHNRLLSSDVKEGEELPTTLPATPHAAELLKDARQIGIPANTSATLGGLLKTGDVVELMWYRAAKGAPQDSEPEFIGDLVVVSVPAGNVPAAPAPPTAAQSEKPAEGGAATNQSAAAGSGVSGSAASGLAAAASDKRGATTTGAVIVLAVGKDKIRDVAAATGGSKWMLTRKSHVSIYEKKDERPAAEKDAPPKEKDAPPPPKE